MFMMLSFPVGQPAKHQQIGVGAESQTRNISTTRFPARMHERKNWIASAFALRASADAVVARAPRNDGVRLSQNSPRHCERRETIQGHRGWPGLLRAPRHDDK